MDLKSISLAAFHTTYKPFEKISHKLKVIAYEGVAE